MYWLIQMKFNQKKNIAKERMLTNRFGQNKIFKQMNLESRVFNIIDYYTHPRLNTDPA